MKHALAISITIVAIVGATSVSAHWPFRVIGTITRVTDQQLDVKRGTKIITIAIIARTTVTRDEDKAKLTVKALEVGQSVVVDAEGDTERQLDASSIRIVPALPGTEDR